LCWPEFAVFGVLENPARVAEVAEDLSGVSSVSCRRSLGTPRPCSWGECSSAIPRDPRPFNTVVALPPDGRLIGSYRKLHLYDAFGFAESELFPPGQHGPPLVFEASGLARGVMTCYDLRFPEIARALVDARADVLLVPSAWVAGPAKEDHWMTLLRARAIENTTYVVAAGQTGPSYVGHSVVVDPMG
jgi:predicted amidohydrolase